MLNINTVLFDLDGTITDSAMGIFNCIEYSLSQFGIKGDRETFYKYLGPSLRRTFADFVSSDKIEDAIALYRVRYSEKGLYECEVYHGVEQMLVALRSHGFRIALATSKPEHYAVKILQHFKLDHLFDFVGGAAMDASRDTKASVIQYVLSQDIMRNAVPVMVGDRMYDINGATQCNIPAVGVLYGYGSLEELQNANAVFVAEDIKQLCDYLINLKGEING